VPTVVFVALPMLANTTLSVEDCHWIAPTLPDSVIVVASPLHTLVAVAVAVPPMEVGLTVSVTALEVAGGLHVPLTTQSKLAPESPVATLLSVSDVEADPLIVPPSLMLEPFSRHW
jgi:hypothetical protein